MLHENVECPSLSPDNTRIAYKKRISPGGNWRLYVLDLTMMHETPLTAYSIDDQVEWLDNDLLLYGFDTKIWVVPADGSGAPRLPRDADSPASFATRAAPRRDLTCADPPRRCRPREQAEVPTLLRPSAP